MERGGEGGGEGGGKRRGEGGGERGTVPSVVLQGQGVVKAVGEGIQSKQQLIHQTLKLFQVVALTTQQNKQ